MSHAFLSRAERLGMRAPQNARKYVLFVLFPVYPESYDKTLNKIHLPRISEAAGKEIASPSKSVQVGEASFDLYLVKL